MRKLFVAPVAALLLASCVTQRSAEVKPAVNRTVTDAPVVFKDANLEAVVRAAIKKPQGVITRKEIASLETLKANNAGISDITGLEHATNLTDLALYNNKVTTLGPLATLTQLTNLSLLDNQITDLAPLAELHELKWLALNDNQVTDVAPLAGLTSLTKLYLGNNKIS
ncbi:MAG: leucine-rich repeat domain-containing protein, partial [Opitutales bacterium]